MFIHHIKRTKSANILLHMNKNIVIASICIVNQENVKCMAVRKTTHLLLITEYKDHPFKQQNHAFINSIL